MSDVVGVKVRANILRAPGDSPGLLFVNGQQWPFTLENVWKSPVAPSVNMAVNVDFDGQGNIVGITAADTQPAARETVNQIGGSAQQQGKQAAEMARQGVGTLASRMGKVALGAAVILWIAWFFMPAIILSVSGLSFIGQEGQSRSITFWDALALDPSNNMNPGSHGVLSMVVIVGIVAPIAASFLRQRWARFLYAAPLACVVLAWFTIQNGLDQVNAAMRQQAAGGIALAVGQMSPAYGTFVIGLASLVLAACIFKSSASESAGTTAKPSPAVVPPGNGFCAKCGGPLSAGENFCGKCRSQRA
jgi:hypothetical protein